MRRNSRLGSALAVVLVLASLLIAWALRTHSSEVDRAKTRVPAAGVETDAAPARPAPPPSTVAVAAAQPGGGGPVSVSSPAAPALTPAPGQAAPLPNAAGPGPTSLPTTEFECEDAGVRRTFDLALDEVWVRTADGNGAPAPVRARDAADLEQQLAAYPGGAAAILYERGVERTEHSRRVVSNLVTAELAAGIDPAPLAAAVGATSFERPPFAPGHVVLHTPAGLASLRAAPALRRMPGVVSAEAQLARQQSKRAMPNDTLINSQWHLRFNNQAGAVSGTDIRVESAWAYPTAGAGRRGRNIRIGIVDDGLQTTHPDLLANVDTANDRDWNGNDFDPTPSSYDDHGTPCAGNAAGVGNNGIGVSGSAPEAKLVGMRLIASVTTDSQEADAFAYLPNIIEIKSNSWGPSDTGTVLEAPGTLALAALQNSAETGRGGKGTIFVWAGGNGLQYKDNSNYDGYANSIYTIGVTAIDSQSRQAYYSEPGASLVVTAPSGGSSPALDITTTDLLGSSGYSSGSYTSDFGGTSSATPTVAGVVALMLEANTALGWRDVQEILMASARKCNPADGDWITNGAGFHFNHKFGAGLVDASAAVTLAAGWTPLEAATSRTVPQTGLAVFIPNQNTIGITRQFDVAPADNLRVEHVTVKVNINHTARGNLRITLESPGGTVSRLAEVHSDSGDHYPNWTFMTVRNWGEDGAGTWKLKITDESNTGNSAGGTLTSATLTVFGTAITPANPPPSVALTAPAPGSVFSPGTPVGLAATASDTTSAGTPGTISKVEFLANGNLIHTDTGAPYSFVWTPSAGSYSLAARATDSDGAISTGQPVLVEVFNQRPMIGAVTTSPASSAFSDEPIQVLPAIASDPESDAVTLAHQWEVSTDGQTFADSPGDIAPALAPGPARSGGLWRCRITPSDAGGAGAPATTAPVAVNRRPPATAVSGEPFSYDSDLFQASTHLTFTQPALINEFSQGPDESTSEWIELLVLKAGSLRGWAVSDSAGNTLTLADSSVWDAVPAGTLVVLYNGASKDPLLPPDDPAPGADGRMIVGSNNAAFLSGTWPSLSNNGDGILLRNATAALIDQLAYGSETSIEPNVGAVSGAESANYRGGTEAGNDAASNWVLETALTSRAAREAPLQRSLVPGASLAPANYTQDFNAIPGATGTAYPDAWTCYDNTVEDALMTVGNAGSTDGANYNYGSRVGLLGSKGAFDVSSLVLALANTSGRADLAVSFDVVKILEQGRSHDVILQYSLSSPTSGFVTVANATYTSGTLAQGTTTAFAAIPLPPALADQPGPVYLRWLYQPSATPGSGSRDGIALDNVVITSAPAGPLLTIALSPSTFSEAAGTGAANGTVTIAPAPVANVTVTLSSSNSSKATVPPSLVIPAHSTTATFSVSAVDNAAIDGIQAVVIGAATANLSANATVHVADNDGPPAGVTPGAANGDDNTTLVDNLRSGTLDEPAQFRLGATSQTPAGLAIDPLTGVLAGTIESPPGNYTIVIERYNALDAVASQMFTLAVVAAAPPDFAQWIAGFPGLMDLTPEGDPDRDGLPNLAEFFLALAPGSPDGHLAPSATVEAGELVLIYRKNKALSGVTGTVLWSDTLGAGAVWSALGVSDLPAGDAGAFEIRRASVILAPGETRKFLRLQFTQP